MAAKMFSKLNFLEKLWLIANSKDVGSICWNEKGTKILINEDDFIMKACDEYPGLVTSNNIRTFLRYLNAYGFKTLLTKQIKPTKHRVRECYHPRFNKGNPALLTAAGRNLGRLRTIAKHVGISTPVVPTETTSTSQTASDKTSSSDTDELSYPYEGDKNVHHSSITSISDDDNMDTQQHKTKRARSLKVKRGSDGKVRDVKKEARRWRLNEQKRKRKRVLESDSDSSGDESSEGIPSESVPPADVACRDSEDVCQQRRALVLRFIRQTKLREGKPRCARCHQRALPPSDTVLVPFMFTTKGFVPVSADGRLVRDMSKTASPHTLSTATSRQGDSKTQQPSSTNIDNISKQKAERNGYVSDSDEDDDFPYIHTSHSDEEITHL